MTLDADARSLSIADVAELTELTAHTLRYYEREGLMLGSVQRASSGHRRYTDGDVAWIVMITKLRSTGMPIREIRAYAELCRHGDGNEEERLQILRAHRERVQAQIAEVTEHFKAIEIKISLYEARLGSDQAAAGAEVVQALRTA